MTQPAKKYYTVEEYLSLEETAEYKSEYYKGEIFAMAGGSANHNRIARNVLTALTQAFESKPCEAFGSDMKVGVKKEVYYTYPDVSVVCGEIEFDEDRTDSMTNPTLIVEVLSPSTADYDRNKKFEMYRGRKSLQDYVLIDQDRVLIEYYHKVAVNEWRLKIYEELNETVNFEAVGVELPIQRIYSRVKFPAQTDNAGEQ